MKKLLDFFFSQKDLPSRQVQKEDRFLREASWQFMKLKQKGLGITITSD